MDTAPVELTWQYIASVPGSALLTVITVNAIRASTGKNWPWLPLAVAFGWQALAWAIWSDHTAASVGLSLATTLFVWLAATGGNDLVAARAERKAGARGMAVGHQGFWRRWA